MKYFLPLMMFFSLSNYCYCQEWHFLSEAVNKDVVYINDDIVKSPYRGTLQVWTETHTKSFEREVGNKTKTYYNVIVNVLYEVDCSNNNLRTVKMLVYDKNKIFLFENDNFSIIPSAVLPGSIGASIIKWTCQNYNWNKP